ncbi:DUF6119 family protein [Actinocrispum sp. NPDC049592]|uniref:DUF6119 family protein n=1 Tax=Actinocrispum sp. NPDC049592 TaxID=3154835 RepID=UPI003432254E
MTADPETGFGETQVSAGTRVTNVYRMDSPKPLHELISTKILEDDQEQFRIDELEVGSSPAVLVSGESETAPVEWVAAVRSLTGVALGFTTATASAALFLRVDDVNYALAFGHGWRYLHEGRIDRQFGLDVAVRLLDPDDIRQVTRWALSAKSRVDRNMVPGGQGLWAFGLREHAELVRRLTGKVSSHITVDLAYVHKRGQRRNFKLGLECGDGLHVPLGIEGDSLVSDLRFLTQVVDHLPVHDRLEPLQWVRRLARGTEMAELLDSTAADLLANEDPDHGEIGVAYPARYYDGPGVRRFRGQIGQVTFDTDDLTVDDLRAGVRHCTAEECLRVLRTGYIEGFDDSGVSLGGEVSALHWMAAEIINPDYRFILIDGDWYEFGEKYLDHVDRVVSDAFKDGPDWELPAWTTAPPNEAGVVVEGAYNRHVAEVDTRFMCLDRKLIRTRIHPRGFEACDLLGPGNVLVHVKKVSTDTGSSALSHLFAQGLVAIESLTDRATWDEFVTLVGSHDEKRAATLGSRPSGLVYAIHRSDKALEPNTLFTFARSALVSASVALSTCNVPLRIAVIP